MSDIDKTLDLTEFPQEITGAFADLLREGGFELVNDFLHPSGLEAVVTYASPTCLLRFAGNTHRGFEWDMDVAQQQGEEQKPNWISVGLLYQFLKKETPEETRDRVISPRTSQISMQEWAERILPYHTQILAFFHPSDFQGRWAEYEEYTERHKTEFSCLMDEYRTELRKADALNVGEV